MADNAFYSAIFEKVYPDRDARARFVLDQLAGRRPHPGQHMLAALVAAGLAPVLITTNFDTLLEDAIRPALDPDAAARLTVLDPESSTRAAFTLATDARPLLMKIHGDLGAVTVKNTTAELAKQDELLRAATSGCSAATACWSPGTAAATRPSWRCSATSWHQPTPYPGGLTWVRRPEDALTPRGPRPSGRRPRRRGGAGARGRGERDDGTDGRDRAGRRPAAPVAAHLAVHRPAPLRYPAPPPSGPVSDYPQVTARRAAAAVRPGPGPAARGPGRAAAEHPAAGAAGRPGARACWPAGPAVSSSPSATTPSSPRRWPGTAFR